MNVARAIGLPAALLVSTALLAATGSDPFAGLADPTRPAGLTAAVREPVSAPVPSRLVLQSVLISPVSRQAIINGKKVGIGDSVGDARVEEIRPHEVVIRRANSTQTLRLLAGTVPAKEQAHD